jgi:hypothetical protein
MHLFHIYTIAEFTLVSFLFIEIIKSKAFKKTVLSILFLFYVLAFFNIAFFESINSYNSNTRSFQGVIMLFYCVYFFYTLFSNAEVKDLSKYPYFWLVSGMIIYYSGTLFLYVLGDRIVLHKEYFTYYAIHNALSIVQNIFFAFTLWLGSKQIKLTY